MDGSDGGDMGSAELKEKLSSDELAALVNRSKSGDESAMAELISRTKNSLFRFLLFLCQDANLAQDLCQDTYVYVLQHIGSLKKESSFQTWLFLIAKNKLFDHRRSRKNQPHSEIESAFRELSAPSRELLIQTREVFSQLSEEDRLVLLLIDLEGRSYAEASEVIGISEPALVSRLHRARCRFHELFFGK